MLDCFILGVYCVENSPPNPGGIWGGNNFKWLTVNWLDNNVMHAKPDLRVFLKWMITDSGSVITAVIWLAVIASRPLSRNSMPMIAGRNVGVV